MNNNYIIEQIKYAEELAGDIKNQLKNIRKSHKKGYVEQEFILQLNSSLYELYTEGMTVVRNLCEIYDEKFNSKMDFTL